MTRRRCVWSAFAAMLAIVLAMLAVNLDPRLRETPQTVKSRDQPVSAGEFPRTTDGGGRTRPTPDDETRAPQPVAPGVVSSAERAIREPRVERPSVGMQPARSTTHALRPVQHTKWLRDLPKGVELQSVDTGDDASSASSSEVDLEVLVTDERDQPVPGATVELRPEGAVRTLLTTGPSGAVTLTLRERVRVEVAVVGLPKGFRLGVPDRNESSIVRQIVALVLDRQEPRVRCTIPVARGSELHVSAVPEIDDRRWTIQVNGRDSQGWMRRISYTGARRVGDAIVIEGLPPFTVEVGLDVNGLGSATRAVDLTAGETVALRMDPWHGGATLQVELAAQGSVASVALTDVTAGVGRGSCWGVTLAQVPGEAISRGTVSGLRPGAYVATMQREGVRYACLLEVPHGDSVWVAPAVPSPSKSPATDGVRIDVIDDHSDHSYGGGRWLAFLAPTEGASPDEVARTDWHRIIEPGGTLNIAPGWYEAVVWLAAGMRSPDDRKLFHTRLEARDGARVDLAPVSFRR